MLQGQCEIKLSDTKERYSVNSDTLIYKYISVTSAVGVFRL